MKKDPYALWRSLFILEKQERDLLLFAPAVSLFGGSEFILRDSDRTGYIQQRFQSSEVPRFFSEVPTLKYSRYCSGSEGIYTPWSSNGYSLFSPNRKTF
jgi:hypothetical protein